MGLIWGAAWGVAGSLVTLGFVLRTGSRPDAPFPIMFGAFGFVAGVVFSAVLSRAEGRRRFDQMSLSRFALWGAVGGISLATTFVVAVSVTGDPGFLRNLFVVGPAFAAAAAGSAAGSLALARKGRDRSSLEGGDQLTPLEASEGRAGDAVRRRK
jgi:hypothetical protein